MSYTKTVWKDKIVEKPLTFRLQTNVDGSTTLIPDEGNVVDPGTPITSTNMNNLEGQYDAVAAIAQMKKITADNGGQKLEILNGEDMLAKLIGLGLGMHTFNTASGSVVNAPSTKSQRGYTAFVGTSPSDMYGHIFSVDSDGIIWFNYLNGSAGWKGWNKLSKNNDSGRLNVKDFGAKGDGVADDSAAIQAALNAVGAGFREVYVPSGTYVIKSTLRIKSDTRMVLESDSTIFRGADINAILINVGTGAGGYNNSKNIEIIGGIWDGNKTAFATVCTLIGIGSATNVKIQKATFQNLFDWHMVELNAVQDAIVSDCVFTNYNGSGGGTEMLQLDLMVDSGVFPWSGFVYDSTPCKNITIERNVFRTGTKGIGSHSSAAGKVHQTIVIRDNLFEALSAESIAAFQWRDVVISDNKFDNCGYAILASTNTDTVFNHRYTNNTILNTKTRAILVAGNVQGGVISGNYIHTVYSHGVGVDRPNQNWFITNNTIQSCGGAGIWNYGSTWVTISENFLVYNNGLNAGRADIMVGAVGTGDLKGANAKVVNNSCLTMIVSYVDLVWITGNAIYTSYTQGAETTNLIKKQNYIGGVIDAV